MPKKVLILTADAGFGHRSGSQRDPGGASRAARRRCRRDREPARPTRCAQPAQVCRERLRSRGAAVAGALQPGLPGQRCRRGGQSDRAEPDRHALQAAARRAGGDPTGRRRQHLPTVSSAAGGNLCIERAVSSRVGRCDRPVHRPRPLVPRRDRFVSRADGAGAGQGAGERSAAGARGDHRAAGEPALRLSGRQGGARAPIWAGAQIAPWRCSQAASA